jgi:hypothetical protein
MTTTSEQVSTRPDLFGMFFVTQLRQEAVRGEILGDGMDLCERANGLVLDDRLSGCRDKHLCMALSDHPG